MKWIKLIIGMVLLPALVGEVMAVFELARVWIPSGGWRSAWFWSFSFGAGLWLIIYFFLPKTFWLYVLGHELTHALAIYSFGGSVSSFKVDTVGGHVKSDLVNWFIALAPYFIPIYSALWMMLWVSVDFYYPLDQWQPIFYFGIGLTWAFHLCFTVSMIRLGQTDISSQGYLFSGVVILGLNLLFLMGFVVCVSDALSWRHFLVILLHEMGAAYLVLWDLIHKTVNSFRSVS